MKFRTLKNWKDPQSQEGPVFFAQLLEELLFDYSLDTYFSFTSGIESHYLWGLHSRNESRVGLS